MRHALVTGAASGLCRALTLRLLDLGWRVTAVDVNADGLDALPDHAALHRLVVDLADLDAVAPALAQRPTDDPVSVVVNGAAFATFNALADADLQTVDRMFRVNVVGAAAVAKALLPDLRATAGTLIQISSMSGRVSLPGSSFYAASKHAIEALSDAWAIEHADAGVQVVVVQPGSLDTNFQVAAAAVTLPVPADSPHALTSPQWDTAREQLLDAPLPLAPAVEKILAALDDPRRLVRVRVGQDADALLSTHDAAPDDVWPAWMLLAHQVVDHGMPTPERVLEVPEPEVAWPGIREAAAARMLWWWKDTAEGQAALERLMTTL